MTFKARLKSPSDNDPLYTKEGFGDGKSPCIVGKPPRWVGSVLSNCVGYAYGRAWEILGRQPVELNYTGAKKPGSAYTWYDQCQKHGLPVGSTPKLGAIACWKKIYKSSGKVCSGHVAIVEEVYSNGSCLVSESAYGGYKFRTSNKGKAMNKGETDTIKWIFQGYVYLLDEQEEEIKKLDKVEIIGRGYSNPDGTNGNKCAKKVIGWTGTVKRILSGRNYPYLVTDDKGIAIAWFKKDELKKC